MDAKHILGVTLTVLFLAPLAYAQLCPDGCMCLTPAEADKQFPYYKQCQDGACAFSGPPSALIPSKWCYRALPDPEDCSEDCECMAEEDAEDGRFVLCNKDETVCDYEDNDPLYCYQECDEDLTLALTMTPENPKANEEIEFKAEVADRDDRDCVEGIELFVNGEKVRECSKGVCKFTGGPYAPGPLKFEAEAFDFWGEPIPSVEQMLESVVSELPPQFELCYFVSGRINNFTYSAETLRVRAGRIEKEMPVMIPEYGTGHPPSGGIPARLPGGGSYTTPGGTTVVLPDGVQTNIIPESTYQHPFADMNWRQETLIIYNETKEVDVIPDYDLPPPGEDEFGHLTLTGYNFSLTICPPGVWRIEPVFVPYVDKCPWKGDWTPPFYKFNTSEVTIHDKLVANFTFTPINWEGPMASIQFSPDPLSITDSLTVTVTAFDPNDIATIRVYEKEITNMSDPWSVPRTQVRECNYTDTCSHTRYTFSSPDVKQMQYEVEMCDRVGNFGYYFGSIDIVDKCHDGLLNQGEQEIDCGGPCIPCDICSVQTLPLQFDWRNWKGQDWISGVKDQANCGSCWAFSALGAIEAKYNIEQNSLINVDLSEQNCVADCGCSGSCTGGFAEDAFIFVRDDDVLSQACLLYDSWDCCSPCETCTSCSCSSLCDFGATYCSFPEDCSGKCSVWQDELWSINDYQDAGTGAQTLKRALVCDGPLSVSSNNWAHSLVLVGWDDDSDVCKNNYGTNGCWILKNSWGVFSGYDTNSIYHRDGYAYLPYYPGHSFSDFELYSSYYAEGVHEV